MYRPPPYRRRIIQRLPAGLAEKGYLVLTYDPVGQGERIQFWNPETNESRLGASTREHSYLGAQCLLLGINLAQYMIWDSLRAMDYLLSRPDVDPNRIGCTGVSGGGTNTAYYVPFDERVHVSMPTCYITGFQALLETRGPQDAEQNLFGQLAVGLDHEDYLALVAPRPLQVGAATGDYFPLAGARRCVESARRVYALLGVADHLSIAEPEQPHGYHLPMRQAAYTWFNHWFGKEEEGTDETPIAVDPDETLYCTRSGNVHELGGESVQSLNRQLLARCTPDLPLVSSAREAERYQQDVRERVSRLLSVFPLEGELHLVRSPQSSDAQVRRERLVFEAEPGILVPGTLRLPQGEQEGTVVLWVDEAGKDTTQAGSVLDALAGMGVSSLAIDPRGLGESGFQEGSVDFPSAGYTWVHRMAYLGFLQARSLLGMRAQDVWRALDALGELSDVRSERVVLVGRGGGALLALCAAGLDERVDVTVAHECLGAYRWIVEHEEYRYDASWFLFGVLKELDITDIAALVAPRPLIVWRPVDQERQVVNRGTLWQAWERTQAAYRVLGASQALRYREDALDAAHLARALGLQGGA